MLQIQTHDDVYVYRQSFQQACKLIASHTVQHRLLCVEDFQLTFIHTSCVTVYVYT